MLMGGCHKWELRVGCKKAMHRRAALLEKLIWETKKAEHYRKMCYDDLFVKFQGKMIFWMFFWIEIS